MKHSPEGNAAHAACRTSVAEHVDRLLARLHPNVSLERRRDDRFPLPILLRLTPLDDDMQPIVGDVTTVVGKNISRRGISFFHELPIPHRRVIVEISDRELGSFVSEVDVTWCRFTKPGWYESGGRLVHVHNYTDMQNHKDSPRVELSQLASDVAKDSGNFVAVQHHVY